MLLDAFERHQVAFLDTITTRLAAHQSEVGYLAFMWNPGTLNKSQANKAGKRIRAYLRGDAVPQAES